MTRWLETWWNRLGTRLQPARPDLEDAPAVLVELAGQWWELALKHAQEAARRELASSERALASERDALEASSRLAAEELAQMRAERESYSTWSTRQQLDVRLHEALETAKSEQEDWTEYVRSVENRALSDVDRARQEVKELQCSKARHPTQGP